jgi:hypothetical protein
MSMRWCRSQNRQNELRPSSAAVVPPGTCIKQGSYTRKGFKMDIATRSMPAAKSKKAAVRTESDGRPSRNEAEDAVRTLIRWAGENPNKIPGAKPPLKPKHVWANSNEAPKCPASP